MKIINITNKLVDCLLIKRGKVISQSFYEHLLQKSLAGLNIGQGGDLKQSGELNCIKYVRDGIIPLKKNNIIIFDVGANEGEYAKALSGIFNNMNTKIFCFEPSPRIYEKLQKNCENIPSIIFNNIGFGNEPKKTTLYSNDERSGLSSLFNRKLDHFNLQLDKTEEVEIQTIDSYCRNNNINEIDFLKIDVEGNEMNVLDGAQQMIKNQAVKYIQFEFGGCNIDSKTYFQDFYYFLTENNYKISRILQDGLHEIRKYRESNEIFLTTNYLAELRVK